MICDLYDEEVHYPILKQWWESYGSIPPHSSQLPMGVVTCDDEGPVAAVFAYRAVDTGVAFLEWFVTHPDRSPLTKLEHGLSAVRTILHLLKGDDYTLIRAYLSEERLAPILRRNFGFEIYGDVTCVLGRT